MPRNEEKPEAVVKAAPVQRRRVESEGVRIRHYDKGGEQEEMYKHLAAQPKVPFYIPLGWGEKEGATQWCQMNGLALIIDKGVMVELPKQVVDHLQESLRMTEIATKPFTINREGRVVRSTQAKEPFAHHEGQE